MKTTILETIYAILLVLALYGLMWVILLLALDATSPQRATDAADKADTVVEATTQRQF